MKIHINLSPKMLIYNMWVEGCDRGENDERKENNIFN